MWKHIDMSIDIKARVIRPENTRADELVLIVMTLPLLRAEMVSVVIMTLLLHTSKTSKWMKFQMTVHSKKVDTT